MAVSVTGPRAVDELGGPVRPGISLPRTTTSSDQKLFGIFKFKFGHIYVEQILKLFYIKTPGTRSKTH